MIQRISVGGLIAAMLMVALAYAGAFLPGGAPAWAPWSLALGIAVSFVTIIAMAAAREGRSGALRVPLLIIFIVLAGGFGAALALPPTDPLDPVLWLGLPPRAAVIMFGIGILPLFAVPVAYALTFEELTLSSADLDRIGELARALREEGAKPERRGGDDGEAAG